MESLDAQEVDNGESPLDGGRLPLSLSDQGAFAAAQDMLSDIIPFPYIPSRGAVDLQEVEARSESSENNWTASVDGKQADHGRDGGARPRNDRGESEAISSRETLRHRAKLRNSSQDPESRSSSKSKKGRLRHSTSSPAFPKFEHAWAPPKQEKKKKKGKKKKNTKGSDDLPPLAEAMVDVFPETVPSSVMSVMRALTYPKEDGGAIDELNRCFTVGGLLTFASKLDWEEQMAPFELSNYSNDRLYTFLHRLRTKREMVCQERRIILQTNEQFVKTEIIDHPFYLRCAKEKYRSRHMYLRACMALRQLRGAKGVIQLLRFDDVKQTMFLEEIWTGPPYVPDTLDRMRRYCFLLFTSLKEVQDKWLVHGQLNEKTIVYCRATHRVKITSFGLSQPGQWVPLLCGVDGYFPPEKQYYGPGLDMWCVGTYLLRIVLGGLLREKKELEELAAYTLEGHAPEATMRVVRSFVEMYDGLPSEMPADWRGVRDLAKLYVSVIPSREAQLSQTRLLLGKVSQHTHGDGDPNRRLAVQRWDDALVGLWDPQLADLLRLLLQKSESHRPLAQKCLEHPFVNHGRLQNGTMGNMCVERPTEGSRQQTVKYTRSIGSAAETSTANWSGKMEANDLLIEEDARRRAAAKAKPSKKALFPHVHSHSPRMMPKVSIHLKKAKAPSKDSKKPSKDRSKGARRSSKQTKTPSKETKRPTKDTNAPSKKRRRGHSHGSATLKAERIGRAPETKNGIKTNVEDGKDRPRCPKGPVCLNRDPAHWIEFLHTIESSPHLDPSLANPVEEYVDTPEAFALRYQDAKEAILAKTARAAASEEDDAERRKKEERKQARREKRERRERRHTRRQQKLEKEKRRQQLAGKRAPPVPLRSDKPDEEFCRWACSACTYLNRNSLRKCHICYTPR